MKPNRLKELLKKGRVAVGIESFTNHAGLVEIMGWTGFDFVFIDTEHAPTEVGATEVTIRAADVTGMTALVRVYENSAPLIGKALDNGAQGVIIPQISSVADAEKAVQAAKYPPLGKRGSCPFTRSAHFGLVPLKENCQRANDETLVILLVEGEEGIKNIPGMLKIKGVDIIFFGPADFGQSIGLPGESFEHPRLFAALKDVVRMCDKAGVAVMTVTSPFANIPYARKIMDAGVKVIVMSSDEALFRQSCQELIKIKDFA